MSTQVEFLLLNSSNNNAVIAIVVFGALACLVLLVTLVHMLFTAAVPAYSNALCTPQERKLIGSPIGLYIASLFLANFLTSLGAVLEANWSIAGRIVQGPGCTTQAFLFQLGSTSTALWSAWIAMSALSTFVLRVPPFSKLLAWILAGVSWSAITFFVAFASQVFPSSGFFYGIAGIWCWITPVHTGARVAFYVWMWFWSLVGAVCALLVFLCLRGNVQVKKRRSGKRQIKLGRGSLVAWNKFEKEDEQFQALVSSIGKTLCWFPICYITLVVPLSVIRMAETFGFPMPAYGFAFAAINIQLLGVLNPLIYVALRRALRRIPVGALGSTASTESQVSTIYGTSSRGGRDRESFSALEEGNIHSTTWTPVPTTKEWKPPSARTQPFSSESSIRASDDGSSFGRGSVASNAPLRQFTFPSGQGPTARALRHPNANINSVQGMIESPPVLQAGETGRHSPSIGAPKNSKHAPAGSETSVYSETQSRSHDAPYAEDQITPTTQAVPSTKPLLVVTKLPAYKGPRAISPDQDALLRENQKLGKTLVGPPPPPRRHRRAHSPSVPFDVDEQDEGSITTSSRPSSEVFPDAPLSADSRPISLGDVASATTDRPDSMRTFWSAYEQRNGRHAEDVPEVPSLPSPASTQYQSPAQTPFGWKSPLSVASNFPSPRHPPSVSAVRKTPSSGSGSINANATRLKLSDSHRRSRSFDTPEIKEPPPVLRTFSPAPSAASFQPRPRQGGPNGSLRTTPFGHAATPSNASDVSSYRRPKPQPGYL